MTFGYRLNARANLALRRLLRADRPVADRSNEEFAAEVEKNYRWNFAVNTMDGAAFWFGLSFISPTTILPPFISKLTDSTLPLAIVSAVALGGWHLPQLFSAPYVERLSHKKAIIVNLGFFFERLAAPARCLVGDRFTPGSASSLLVCVFLFCYQRWSCCNRLAGINCTLLSGEEAWSLSGDQFFPGRGYRCNRSNRSNLQRTTPRDASLSQQLCSDIYDQCSSDHTRLGLPVTHTRTTPPGNGPSSQPAGVLRRTTGTAPTGSKFQPLSPSADFAGSGQHGPRVLDCRSTRSVGCAR